MTLPVATFLGTTRTVLAVLLILQGLSQLVGRNLAPFGWFKWSGAMLVGTGISTLRWGDAAFLGGWGFVALAIWAQLLAVFGVWLGGKIHGYRWTHVAFAYKLHRSGLDHLLGPSIAEDWSRWVASLGSRARGRRR